MRPVAVFIVALSLAVVAFGSAPAAGLAAPTSAGSSPDGCGCPRIASVRVTPAAAIGPEVNYTLHANAVRGWGISNATISDPGPNITVYIGDKVFLTLVGNDSVPHNWFLDFNNNQQPDVGEPSSPDFNSLTGPKIIVWNFTADRPGTWTYRCRFHPTSMKGTIEVLPKGRPLNASLFGDSVGGWGTSNATITDPGPDIIVAGGALVTLTLISRDSSPHNWFLDYNDNVQPDVGEPSSPDFNTLAGPKVVVWNFTADRPGEYHYRCRYHPTSMIGTIIILGEERPPPAGPGIGLIPGILLVSLAGVLVFAVVYHARAVRATKRRR